MKRPIRWVLMLGALGALAMFVAACGSSSKSSSSSSTTSAAVAKGVKGGKLTVLAAADVDYIDPGQTYYTFGYMVNYAINRPLYSFKPDDALHPVNDTAVGPPLVSADGLTITVKIKPGIKYAPPVNRAMTTKDIKYAIERAFSANVPSGYAATYFGSIAGAPTKPTNGVKPISGITTPDDQTLVIKLSRPESAVVTGAMVMPITVPVPEEYAKPFDAKNPSTYDQYAAMNGPYMISNNSTTGELTGRKPGKSIDMVRNPNWVASTDYRPAYLDSIFVEEGNTDATVSSRRILNGQQLVNGDGAPPAPVLKQATQKFPDQLVLVPSGGTRYVAMNTSIKPFDNVNVRKAVVAAFDRNAMRLTRGGAIVGDIAWSYLPPNFPGFEESGGLKPPPEDDFLANPSGDMAVATKYMKMAGYPTGKYTGSEKFLTIATNADPGKQSAEVAQAQFAKLGFKLNFREVPQDTLYTKFCGVPKAAVVICPNVGWFKDFVDPESMIKPTFYGPAILAQGNVNWPQLNDPAVNKAIDAATPLPTGPGRNKAWADINKQIAALAPAIPWVWDKTPLIRSKDVVGVANEYATVWDLSFSSLTK